MKDSDQSGKDCETEPLSIPEEKKNSKLLNCNTPQKMQTIDTKVDKKTVFDSCYKEDRR